jgi:hypothetical protein
LGLFVIDPPLFFQSLPFVLKFVAHVRSFLFSPGAGGGFAVGRFHFAGGAATAG